MTRRRLGHQSVGIMQWSSIFPLFSLQRIGGLRGVALGVLLAGLLVGAGCGTAPEQSLLPVPLPALDGMAEAAREQLREQHARTLDASPDTPPADLAEAYGTLGQLLYTYDFLDAADPAFRNAHALRPNDVRWPYYLGLLTRQRGDFEAAAAHYEAVLDLDPDDALARLRLADALLEAGRAEEAEAHLEAVLEAEPRNAYAHFLRGQMALEAGAYADAVTYFEAVLALQPTATQVHTPLGMAYRNLGDPEKSQYHLERRGNALVQLRDPRVQALEAFKQTTGATALTTGQRLIDAGRYREAIATLTQAAEQDPDNASVYLSLGVARSYAGDQRGAVAAFEQVLQIDSTHSRAHYNLGALYAAGGQPARAEARFRAALAHDPRHRNANLELAELLRRSGRCSEAVAHFEATLELTPGDVGARQHLALCYLRLDRPAAARALLEDGLAAVPNHLGFADALARVLSASPDAATRDGARALRLAQQILGQQRRTETLETLAMAYAELGRFDEAVSWQQEALSAAEALGHRPYLDHLRQNLRRYRQRQPARTPWPEFMYSL